MSLLVSVPSDLRYVIVHRLHAMALDQPESRLAQDFEFGCKAGWTYTPKHEVTARLNMRVLYAFR